MNSRKSAFFVLGLILFFCASSGWAQSSGNIAGVVKDASGGVLANATVAISDPVSGYHREPITGPSGDFRFTNIPFNPYHLVVNAKGFALFSQDVDVRSAVPVSVDISLKLGAASENITVEATGADLVETESTPHTDVDRALAEPDTALRRAWAAGAHLMARNFTLSRRFDQAIAVLDALLAEKPNDIAARLLLVDALTKSRQFDAALALSRAPRQVGSSQQSGRSQDPSVAGAARASDLRFTARARRGSARRNARAARL